MIRTNELLMLLMDEFGEFGIVQIHKLTLLWRLENEESLSGFVRHLYGAYNPELADFIYENSELFKERYLLNKKNQEVMRTSLSDKGKIEALKFRSNISKIIKDILREFRKKYSKFTQTELTHYIYSKYPEWRSVDD